MNKIMKMATVMAGVGAMLGFAGCGAKAPDQVALDVLKTLQEGKADQAFLEKNCTKETAGVFVMFGGMMMDATKGATWSATQTYIDDDVAMVMIKQSGGKKPGEEAYYLKKIDGQWKLHMDKENPGKDMISKTTAAKLLHSYKEDCIVDFNEAKLGQFATPDFVTMMKAVFGADDRKEMSEKDKKEMASLKSSELTVVSTEIEKDSHDKGAIEFSSAIKEFKGKLTVQRVNGEWKLSGMAY